MKYRKKKKIKKGLIAQYVIFFIMVTVAGVCFVQHIDLNDDRPEPLFTIKGDDEVLNKMVINIESILKREPYTYSKVQTLLHQEGKRYVIKNKAISFYKIYFSYGDQVGVLEFEKKYTNGGINRINAIEVIKRGNWIYIEYSPRDNDNRNEHRISDISININDYFAERNIAEEHQQHYKNKFYGFHYPDAQKFKKEPLTNEFVENFKRQPIEQKISYNLDLADITAIDLPMEEKDLLTTKAKNKKPVKYD